MTVSKIFRRAASTVSASTKQLAEELFHKATSAPSVVRKQLLNANQAQHLSLTLNRPNLFRDINVNKEGSPLAGTPLPLGYHLIYFTPAALPGGLGPDGTDRGYSPASPFTRRMWAGGNLNWTKSNALRIGEEVTETTKLVSAQPKVTRRGEDMIVVSVEKVFENARGIALVDKRDWVFKRRLEWTLPLEEPINDIKADDKLPQPADASVYSRDFTQSPVTLFRFSALTFNGHMIHYSGPWCREVEGYRDIVVHGPLNLINMLDFWRDMQTDDHKIPQSIRYRATAPFFVNEKYRALMEKHGETSSIKLWGRDGKGDVQVGMHGDVVD